MNVDLVTFVKFTNNIGLNVLLLLVLIAPLHIWPRHFSIKASLISKFLRGVWSGTIIALIILIPSNSMSEFNGFQIDVRQPALTVVAFFFGPVTGLTSMIFAALARISTHDAGIWFGLWSIAASTIVGLFGFYIAKWKGMIANKPGFYYLLGMLSTVLWNASNFYLPGSIGSFVWSQITPYMLIIFPVLTMLLALTASSALKHINDINKLQETADANLQLFHWLHTPLIGIHPKIFKDNERTKYEMAFKNAQALPYICPKAIESNDFLEVINGDKSELVDHIENIATGVETTDFVEAKITGADGKQRAIDIRAINYTNEKNLIAIALTDRTNEHRLEQLNFKLKYGDALCGIGNRVYLEGKYRLISDLEDEKVVTLIALHLVDLFQLNASIGHQLSDKILIEISKRLKKLTLGAEVTLGKFSGATFGLIFKDDSDHLESTRILEGIRYELGKPFDDISLLEPPRIHVGVVRKNGLDFNEMLATAKISLSRIPVHNNDNPAFKVFDPEAYDQYMQQLTIADELKHTLDKSLLDVNFQPIVSAKTRQIVKAEALVRWHHPVLGFISPATFIPIAEDIGLIGRIGKAIREQVVEQLVKWKAQGIELPVSINVSPLELNNCSFNIRQFELLLDEHGLGHELLTFEITEMSMVDKTGLTKSWFDRVSISNFTVAIDDFGVGYSSLAQLDTIDANYLKIDKSFVDDLESNPTKIEVVQRVVQIAHSYSMHVVVEGIETEEQASLLSEINCDYFQGYYFHRPMPGRELTSMLLENRKVITSKPKS